LASRSEAAHRRPPRRCAPRSDQIPPSRFADDLLIASRADPFGEMRSRIVEHERRIQEAPADPRPIVSVYTDTTRVTLRTETFEHGSGAHVLNGRMAFRTQDMGAVMTIARALALPEVTYQRADGSSGGMRDAQVSAAAISPEGETVLMNGPGYDYRIP